MRPKPASGSKLARRLGAAILGLLLLTYLIRRAGSAKLLDGIAAIGWGLLLVIALAGVSHVVRTWAWRITLRDEKDRASFARMLALRLTSEAAAQIGVFGQVFGDTWRIAKLGADLPMASRVTSVALDRTLFTLSSTFVTIAGIISALFLLPLPHKTAVYADIFVVVLVGIIAVCVVAVRNRWAVLSGPARSLGRLGFGGRWVESKRSTILSVETKLLDFFHYGRKAFWGSLALNLAGHLAAILEVYLILRLMGQHAGFFAALAIEGLTKLVNAIGLFNPGNIGTYEGGNMLFGKMIGIGATAGLTLGLIRRIRALFWGVVGVVCFVMLPKPTLDKSRQSDKGEPADRDHAAVILTDGLPIDSVLARVGTLPVLLRAILGAQKAGAARIVVVADSARALRLQKELQRTHRLPDNVEWHASVAGEIGPILRDVAGHAQRIVLIAADRTYHPSLHRRASESVGPNRLSVDHRRAARWHLCDRPQPVLSNSPQNCPPGTRTHRGVA